MSSRVAKVTGASQGIGRATAIRLARDFVSIVLVARNRPNLDETASLVEQAGAKALVVDPDLSEPHTAGQVVERTLAAFGEIEEIAELMAFVVSPAARRMTGSTLRMDGGEVKSI